MTGGAVHQGFVLRVSEFAYSELSVIMDKAEQEENPLVLILDGLNDPHNFGSILRTADATQVTGVIIPKHRAVGGNTCRCQDINRGSGTYSHCSSDQS